MSAPRNGLSAAPRRRSQTPTVQHTASRLPQTQPAPGLRSLPSRMTHTAPQLEKSREGNDAAITTQVHRPANGVTIDESTMKDLPLTPTRHGVPSGTVQVDNPGPSLPSTPSQLGLEAPYERPKGLLFGEPSKGAKKRHDGPSPSKPKEAISKQTLMTRSTNSVLGSKFYLPGLPRPPPSTQQVNLHKKIFSRRQLEQEALSSGSSQLEGILLVSWQNPGVKDTAGHQRQRKKLTDLSNKLLRLREDIEQLQSSIGGNDESLSGQTVQPNGATSRSVQAFLYETITQYCQVTIVS